MRASASTSALPPATSDAEQRKQRLIESRKKYSNRITRGSDSQNSSTLTNNSSLVPSCYSRPRMSRAPSDSSVQNRFGGKSNIQNLPSSSRHQNNSQNSRNFGDEEFRIDHRSMAMIESGNVVIPAPSRPSFYGTRQPRSTLGSNNRPLQMGKMGFRSSMAPQHNEPRPSLFPLGINIFTASEAQKSEVEGWVKERCDAMTPAKPRAVSTLGPIDLTKSTQKIVRFRENSEDQKENSDYVAEASATMKMTLRSKIVENAGNFASPVSIMKVERKKIGFATPIPPGIKGRIDFEEHDEDDVKNKNMKSMKNEKAEEKMTMKQTIVKLEKIFNTITANHSTTPATPSELKSMAEFAEKLANFVRTQNPEVMEKMKKTTSTNLVPICEDDDEEEQEEEEDVVIEKFGNLEFIEISPQKLLATQQSPSPNRPISTMSSIHSSSSPEDMDRAFLD
ncbi:hypothetical protein L3Y34_018073 [Caenorhabditis briggsae]|uniref:Uncharacterized protein n=2 Tax=Caenorhabditis briggsae TaxID=6238 RepID=A0AAE9DJ64_CAEBR|nr:hypothetical protein L3Y34_018073 [Caenorhabditis briggsae]